MHSPNIYTPQWILESALVKIQFSSIFRYSTNPLVYFLNQQKSKRLDLNQQEDLFIPWYIAFMTANPRPRYTFSFSSHLRMSVSPGCHGDMFPTAWITHRLNIHSGLCRFSHPAYIGFIWANFPKSESQWCERQDLNPHSISTRQIYIYWCPCLPFHHSHIFAPVKDSAFTLTGEQPEQFVSPELL